MKLKFQFLSSLLLGSVFATIVVSADNFINFAVKGKLSYGGEYKDTTVLKIPHTSLSKPFVIHSLFSSGPKFGSFAADTEKIVFHFKLSDNKKSIQLVRDNFNIRTTDKQMKYAVDKSAWPGHVVSIPIISTTSGEYIIAGKELFENGFFVHSKDPCSKFNVVKDQSSSHKKNANFLVEYSCEKVPGLRERLRGEESTPAYRLFFSLYQLPDSENVMKPRVSDNRVGYFSTQYTDIGKHKRTSNRQSDDFDRTINIINRRRLEKDENNNVKNPITFHIDPSVPLRWRSTFKEGVEMWNTAFEKAGFKNAIRAVLPGDNDWPEDYHIGDMRYDSISIIVQAAISAIAPSVFDPRSGEILHADISFGDKWLKKWYENFEDFTPVKPSTPSVRETLKMNKLQCHMDEVEDDATEVIRTVSQTKFGSIPEHIVKAGARWVVMHEVGHTLGLRHNFYGSAARTPEQLNDDEFVKKHGVTSSVMDYTGANIWSSIVNKDPNSVQYFSENIGEYDIAAIVYGYKEIEGEVSTYKHAELEKLAASAPLFGTDEDIKSAQNPYFQKSDLSSDPIFYYQDRMKLQTLLRKNITQRVLQKGDTSDKLWTTERYYMRIVKSFSGKLASFIGGINITHAHPTGGNLRREIAYISRRDQLRAIEVLKSIITGKDGLYPNPDSYDQYIEKSGYACGNGVDSICLSEKVADVDSSIQDTRSAAVKALVNIDNLKRIILQGRKATLSVEEVLTAAVHATFTKTIYSHDENVQAILKSAISSLSVNSDSRIKKPAKVASTLLRKLARKVSP